jgi:hypothetical protein
MRRTVVLPTMIGITILLVSGVVFAADMACPNRTNICNECWGTDDPDIMRSADDLDQMFCLGGDDSMGGGDDSDTMNGGTREVTCMAAVTMCPRGSTLDSNIPN